MRLFEYGKIVPYRRCSWSVSPQSLAGWGGVGLLGWGWRLREQGRLLFVMSSF